jgi:hypothetical protein
MTDDKHESDENEIELTGGAKGFSLKAKGASAAGVRIGVSVAIVILSVGVVIAGVLAAYMVVAR